MAVDRLIEDIRKTGRLDAFTFGQKRDPCTSIFKKIFSLFTPPPQNVNANIGVTLAANPPGLRDMIGGSPKAADAQSSASGVQTLWTKTDAAMYRQVDPETLEPIGYADQTVLHPSLVGNLSGAHAKSDPVTGDVFNYNLDLGRVPTYRIFRVSAAAGQTDVIATITDAPSAYLHSLLITKNYVLLCVWNAHYAWGGLKLLWERNILDAIGPFNSEKKALWYVIDRVHDKGVVAKFESDAFFCFHVVNAWEEASPSDPSDVDIVADLSVYENLDILKRLYYDNLSACSVNAPALAEEASHKPMLRRFRLQTIHSRTASQPREAVTEFTAPRSHSAELPSINPRMVTQPSRYIYGVTDSGKSALFDGLVKYDMHTHEATFWFHHGQNPGEPIFVANPDGTDEDDGVLLSVVLDGLEGKSFLLVLDARNMKELGRASMECAVGFGFHGLYLPSSFSGIGTEV
ncbi:carotenoid oxygenase [Phlebopus sp. FC_14]|nr:carotenoid oxygenase [Phlebopus sp. FC_14]